MLESREVVNVDIAYDELPEKHYTPEEVRGDGAYYIISWPFIAHHFLCKSMMHSKPNHCSLVKLIMYSNNTISPILRQVVDFFFHQLRV